jgi:hypothetical protein
MAPLHQPFDDLVDVDDDGHHDDAVFLPLDHRRWSNASDVSAYCIHPDDGALRRHPYRPLQTKKVAVVGSANIRSIVCASTLKQDGHQVTVLTSSSQVAAVVDIKEHQCHPDFSLDEHQSDINKIGSTYLQACALHFGVTLKFNTHVVEMNEKYGGWVLTCHHADSNHLSNEYFDCVVFADLIMDDASNRPPNCRFYEQFLLPSFLVGLILGRMLMRTLWNVWNTIWTSTTTSEQRPQLSQAKSHTMTPSYDPLPAKYQIRSNPSLYRNIISPNVPRVVFLEHPGGASSTYLASVWLSTMLYDEMDVSADMIASTSSNQRCRSTFRYNDLLLQDLGMNCLRKRMLWQEYFETYTSLDYRGILHQVQERRRISRQEGWAVPLTPLPGNV